MEITVSLLDFQCCQAHQDTGSVGSVLQICITDILVNTDPVLPGTESLLQTQIRALSPGAQFPRVRLTLIKWPGDLEVQSQK